MKFNTSNRLVAMTRRCHSRPGFALIVTLSLMILLTVVAVGLLSLAGISLRASGQSNAIANARANARLAMMLALNDLQVNAGPDTRITASAGTLGITGSQESITGVWNSRKLDPASPKDTTTLTDVAKAADFRRWLVSNPNVNLTKNQDFAQSAAPTGVDARKILSKRYALDGKTEMIVASVPVTSSSAPAAKVNGRFAYAVFDEGAKARVNLGIKPPTKTNLATRAEQLGSGQRLGVDRIDGVTAPTDDMVDLSTTQGTALVSKMISLGNTGFVHKSDGTTGLEKHFNDVTPYSLGLLTDVSNGGMKKDLNLLASASASPPSGYGVGNGIYKTSFGLSIPSDPTWSQALKFANLYNNKAVVTSGTGGVPTMKASAPADWSASSSVKEGIAVPNTVPPTSPVLLPSIAKVQMVYSLQVHDIYKFGKTPVPTTATFINGPYNAAWKANNKWDDNWSTKNQNRDINYQLWAFCTPIVTLHNPYNVALEIPAGSLEISFVNVPFAMRFFINGQAQTSSLIPYSDMFYWNNNATERRYTLTLNSKSVSGSTVSVGSGPITLLPGEVRVFSPYMDANATYFDTKSAWYNVYNGTTGIKAIPGWQGEGIGFGQDILSPRNYSPLALAVDAQGRTTGNGRATNDGLVLTGDENIQVEFAPIPATSVSNNNGKSTAITEKRFTVEMTLKGANSTANSKSVVLDFDYETTDGLQKAVLGPNGTIKWPADGPIAASELREHWQTPLKDFTHMKPFALLSAYAKTTHGGVDSSGDDGRYAAKPWIFNNHAGAVMSAKIGPSSKAHPSHYSHDINLVRLPGHTEEAIDIQPNTDRGSFITGHTVFNGRRFGTMLDIPLGPLQSPVSLNGANLAAGYYLPRFTAPIGNSFAHPVMASDTILADVNGQKYADHSYLLNSVFFDSYYCSGFQTQAGNFGDSQTPATMAKQFFENNGFLADTRLQAYLPDGEASSVAVTAVTGSDGYKKIASHQLLQGAFNVNSTSVGAWKAVLSAMKGSKAAVATIPGSGTGTSASITTLADPSDKKGARFSRFRLPNGQPDAGDPDALWTAPRDLTAAELDKLATEIVRQVRDRGPFLSMSEFVNRQIGASSQKTLVGTLQAAIDNSEINKASTKLGGYDIDSVKLANLKLLTPDALLGPSAQGAPGTVMQSDILSVLGNSATVRSDTFVIRAYGESVDATGKAEARVWCEAVIQRLPEYVDPKDGASVAPGALTSEANKIFGRRFGMISFRWLSPEEV